MSRREIENTSNDIEMLFFFTKEMNVLNEELDDMKALYIELKSHYDRVKNSKSYGVLEFLSNQTKNLISLKMAIISLIRESVNIKKIAKEIELKNKSSEVGEDSAVLKSLIRILKTGSEDIIPLNKQENVSLEYRKDDEDLDSVLDKRINDSVKKLKDVNLEELGYRLVFDEDKNQYLLDDEDQLVEDLKLKRVEVTFKRNKKTKERYAKDEDGNKYDIVDIADFLT